MAPTVCKIQVSKPACLKGGYYFQSCRAFRSAAGIRYDYNLYNKYGRKLKLQQRGWRKVLSFNFAVRRAAEKRIDVHRLFAMNSRRCNTRWIRCPATQACKKRLPLDSHSIATRLPLDCHTIATGNCGTFRMCVKQGLTVRNTCVLWVGDFTSCWESIVAIVRQSSGSRVAIEWQSSGNRKTCTRGHKVGGCPKSIVSMTIACPLHEPSYPKSR